MSISFAAFMSCPESGYEPAGYRQASGLPARLSLIRVRRRTIERGAVESILEGCADAWPTECRPYNMLHGFFILGVPDHHAAIPATDEVANAIYSTAKRVAGWIRHAPEYPLLWRVIQRCVSRRGMRSPRTLLSPVHVAQSFTSPSAPATARKVRSRSL